MVNLATYKVQSFIILLFGVFLFSQLYMIEGIFFQSFISPLYFVVVLAIVLGVYRISRLNHIDLNSDKTSVVFALSLFVASILHGVLQFSQNALFFEPLLANVLVGLSVMLPVQRRLQLSIGFWLTMCALVALIAYVQMSQEGRFVATSNSKLGVSQVLDHVYVVFSIGLLLTINHFDRFEFQKKFHAEENTKLLLEKLNKLVAHNMRTPLTTLMMQLELKKLEDSAQIMEIEAPIKKLVRTVEDILDFSIEGEEMSTKELFEKIEHLSDRIELKLNVGSNFTFDNSRAIFFSVQNFVSNALKHSKGKVVVSIMGYAGKWKISVQDEGQGMDNKTLKNYGLTTISQTGGLGIGLSLTKDLAELNDFTFICQSRQGLGTVVHLGSDCKSILENLIDKWPTKIIICPNLSLKEFKKFPSLSLV